MASVPGITLNDGTTIPQLGFGVFQIDPEKTVETVQAAFDAGYRHIDTAQMYANEDSVGAGLAASDVPRSAVYLTTKLDALPAGTYEVTMEFAELKNRAVPDWRMFDVSVNGEWALVRHDVADEVGLLTADTHTYVIEVPEGGSVDVQFWDRRSYKAPIVNAISVVQRPDM